MRPIDRQLLEACEEGGLHTAQGLLQQGANPNSRDQRGQTLIMIAAEHGHTDIIALLVQHGADPRIRDPSGQTALHHAVKKRHRQTTEYLITELQLDPNKADACGVTPFLLAAQNGDIPMLQLLIQLGANPSITDRDQWNALHWTAIYQHPSAAQYLITQLQLDPNAQDLRGENPFLLAASKGDIEMLRLLARHGANPHAPNHQGENAIHGAVKKNHHHAVQYLISQLSLDPNQQDHEGITPFMIAAEIGNIKMLRLLIRLGANPYLTDHQGRNALHYAAEWNQYKTAHFLINHLHFDPNTQDHDGNTPLHLALYNLSFDTAKNLIRIGAYPHIPNHQGQTPTAIARQHRIRLPKPQPSTITL